MFFHNIILSQPFSVVSNLTFNNALDLLAYVGYKFLCTLLALYGSIGYLLYAYPWLVLVIYVYLRLRGILIG